jgi:hypothetical protein
MATLSKSFLGKTFTRPISATEQWHLLRGTDTDRQKWVWESLAVGHQAAENMHRSPAEQPYSMALRTLLGCGISLALRASHWLEWRPVEHSISHATDAFALRFPLVCDSERLGITFSGTEVWWIERDWDTRSLLDNTLSTRTAGTKNLEQKGVSAKMKNLSKKVSWSVLGIKFQRTVDGMDRPEVDGVTAQRGLAYFYGLEQFQ